MFLHFAYAFLAPFLLSALGIVALYRWWFFKPTIYRYPLTQTFASENLTKKTYHKTIFILLRLLTLTGLAILVMRPQWVDERSKIHVEGIDIILTIDVSHSMIAFDDPNKQESRIDVAKREAIRFIEKRQNDPIGVVIFGNEALSRCPLTLDKSMLKEIVGDLKIGVIDPRGTWLGTGIATAVNRLKSSPAKSKIIILLTDGEPTAQEKIDPSLALELAQKFGIKIYAVGIGSEEGGFVPDPFFGVQQVPYTLNTQLLQTIAQKTGGRFFHAKNPSEMRTIYDTIDKLEKTKHETNIFSNYYEAFHTLLWLVVALFLLELMLRLFIWRGV